MDGDGFGESPAGDMEKRPMSRPVNQESCKIVEIVIGAPRHTAFVLVSCIETGIIY